MYTYTSNIKFLLPYKVNLVSIECEKCIDNSSPQTFHSFLQMYTFVFMCLTPNGCRHSLHNVTLATSKYEGHFHVEKNDFSIEIFFGEIA